jgi:hypothetical protein
MSSAVRAREAQSAAVVVAAIAFVLLLLGTISITFAIITGRSLDLGSRVVTILGLWGLLVHPLLGFDRAVGAALSILIGACVVAGSLLVVSTGSGDVLASVFFPSVMGLGGTAAIVLGVRRLLGGSRAVSRRDIGMLLGVLVLSFLVARG